MTRIKSVLSVAFTVALLGGIGWLLYKVTAAAYHAFAALNQNVAVAIVAGSATVLGSTFAVVLTRYYQSKREREVAHRDRKIDAPDRSRIGLFIERNGLLNKDLFRVEADLCWTSRGRRAIFM